MRAGAKHRSGMALLIGALLLLPAPLAALPSGDYFLHSASNDFLNTTSPIATRAKFKDSPAVNRTAFKEIGVWAAAPADGAQRLTTLSDLHVWLGLKNSDDQGTYFDLRAELLKNGAVIASGETLNIQGVTRNPARAKEVTVAFGSFAAVQLAPGDVLSLRILTKVTAQGGHSNAVGLRLYYDAVRRPSRFGTTFTACSAETCNGADDDCDGAIDEGFNVGSACTAGVGACERSGVLVCSADGSGTFCDATPGVPTTEVCNGADDDCNGEVDEDLGTLACGVGACTRTVAACVNGQPGQCTPGSPSPETCNGVDDDCDGTTDNGFDIGASCTVGIGACQSAGAKICSEDGSTTVCNATPETPQLEICGNDVDEDCDGTDLLCGVAISITNPPNLSAFNRSLLAVTGTVAAEAVEVQCNDTPAGLTNGGFGVAVSLKEGNNTITCVAQDAAGHVGAASIQVTLDTTPPRVTIQTPRDGALLTATPVSVTGMINDIVVGTVNVEEARVECNGVNAQVANRAFVADAVPLNPGTNTITCTGIDRAGNVDAEHIGVTLDTATPAKITLVSGNNQTGYIEELLPEPLVVFLTENGNPAPGKPVVFKVLRNNGAVSSGSTSGRSLTVNTDATGRAEVRFTLGTWAGAGNNQVEATAVGFVGEALFSASALPADPGLIVVDAGNNQEGIVGQNLPRPFVATVVDRGSNRLGNVPVTFTVTQGNGNFAGQPAVTITTDSNGLAQVVLTLGPEEGFDNNVVKATFPGNTGGPAVFVASGKIPGNPDDTILSGVVLDNSNIPIAGVTLHVEGTALTTQSDDQGQFVLQPAPVGHVKLVADGATAQRAGTWPKLEYELVTIPGHNNTIGMPIYLLPLDLPHGLLVDETNGGTLTLPEVPGFALTVLPGSATFPDGTKRGLVNVTVVHADKVPMVPNFGQQPRFIITIQPAGTHFNPPAALTMPNVDGLSPGQKTEMYSFDHDLGQFVSIGPGTVSEDGTVLQSDPGVGVLKGGWHCGGDPNQTGGAEATFVGGPQNLVTVVGKEIPLTVIGAPGPGAAVPFTWASSDPEIVAISGFQNVLGEEEVTSVALVRGITSGTATVMATYAAQPTEPDKPGEMATAEVEVDVIDVQVQSADVTQDSIVVHLSPSGVSGTLRLELRGSTTHVIREEQRAGGIHNEAFNIPNLAEGEYTQVKATWKVQEASTSGELDYHIKVLGKYRHSQYNTVAESTCTGGDDRAYLITENASGISQCFSAGQFTTTTLRSSFIDQVNLNGSGRSINFGDIKRDFFCPTTSEAPQDAPGITFRQTPITPSCAGGTLGNDTVAVGPHNQNLSCGDRIFIHGIGVKTVTDACPGCPNRLGPGVVDQLDNYTTDDRCSGIIDLGDFVTIKLFP